MQNSLLILMMILQPYEEPSNVVFWLVTVPILPCIPHSIAFLGMGWAKVAMTKQKYHALSDAEALVQKTGDIIKEEYDPSFSIPPDWEPNTSQISLLCTWKDLEGYCGPQRSLSNVTRCATSLCGCRTC